MMILLMVFGYFCIIVLVGGLLLSHQLRDAVLAIPQHTTRWFKVAFKQLLMAIPTPRLQRNSSDYQQQIWIVLAGLVLLSAPVLWVATREPSALPMDYNAFRDTDPQVYALLEGEMLVPPPEVATDLIVAAEQVAQSIEAAATPPVAGSAVPAAPVRMMLQSADRKWSKMNARYVQRLLLVFKMMKERYGYDMVLLEGYRSPERQNRLASMGANVTHATGYRSYHQFGLAGDVAFMRNGKVVISERDPWAMQGYKYYGEVAESVDLVWGGRWKMMDLGHTEFRMPGILGKADIAAKLTSEGTVAPAYE